MKNYLYLYPESKIKEIKTKTSETFFLISPTLEQKQFELNETAVEIISLFNGLKTYDEIVQNLAYKYSETFQSIENKIKPFINQMIKQYGYEIREQSEPIPQYVSIFGYANYYPTVANIELTNKCNVRCRHCYGKYNVKNRELISLKDIYSIIESLSEIGISILELTGGDPTMYPYTSNVIEKAFEVGISTVMILTNGIHFNQKLLETIIRNKDRIYLQIDLHSLEEQYYDWFTNSKNNLHKVKNNIDSLVSNGVRIRVCAIFTPGNVHELAEIGEWAYNHGAIKYAPSVTVALGRAKTDDVTLFFQNEEEIEKFRQQQRLLLTKYPNFIDEIIESHDVLDKNCGAICSQVSIKANGDIKLCNMDSGEYFNLKIGNVITDPIKELFDSNKQFLTKFKTTKPPMMRDDACKNCELVSFCSNCFLRGILGARKLFEMNRKCEWYQKIHPVVQERFPLLYQNS